MEWRLIKDGYHSGFMNMAIDESIMIAHEKNLVPPTIRFYQWDPAAVSLGYFQDLKNEINIDTCRRLGIDIVRRLTGGKAVLHDKELTYSFVINEKYPMINHSILGTYKKISHALIEGLASMAINAELVPLKQRFRGNTTHEASCSSIDYKAICFSTPSQYEVQVKGKKLIGSAQVRRRGIVLQHGSLLIKLNKDILFSVFNFPSKHIEEKLRARFKATSLEEIGHDKIEFSQLSLFLYKGFEKEFGINLCEGSLTKFEEKLSLDLFHKKYSTGGWNFKKQYQQDIYQ